MAPVATTDTPLAVPRAEQVVSVPATKHILPASKQASQVDTDQSLPAQWFRDERIFHIERRAIFSKLWLLATHTSRFRKAGDYLKLELAGYPFFVIKDKEGGYNAFHNVCRHRAFPLIHKETGTALVLGCKYHGWSYSSSTGHLIKAPQFNNSPTSPNSDKKENGLFKIHTHVTDTGFIFINFNAAPIEPSADDLKAAASAAPSVSIGEVDEEAQVPKLPDGMGYTVPFKEHFGTLPNEWDGFHPEDYEYSYTWTRTGPYNWKTFMDGYQECYHCHIAHPGFAKSLALETYAVATKTNYARHTASSQTGPTSMRPIGAPENEISPTFTFVFPINGVTVTETMWYMMRAVPVSACETRMEYDVFKRKEVAYDDLRKYMEFYEQVEDEDYLLVCATQRNLNSGIYSRGFLHPEKENGVLFYQSRARAFVEEHLAKEKEVGYEINPAQPISQRTGSSSCAGSDAVCGSLGPEMTW